MSPQRFREITAKHNFDAHIKKGIKELYKYNNFRGIAALLADYFCIAIAILLTEANAYWYPLTLLIIGSRQRALATILHEAAHKTLARNRHINRSLGTFFSGYLIFQTWEAYTRSHVFKHHSKFGCPSTDPDLQHYISSGVFEEMSRDRFILRFLLKPILCANIAGTIRYLFKNRLASAGNKYEYVPMGLTLAFFIAIGSSWTGWEFFIMYWLIPYLTAFQAITWFIELSEHYPLIKDAKDDIHATRNRFSHLLEAFFTSMHGENFHLVHHLFPGIPFWNLKRAHHTLLQDPEYARINASFGGIFLSANFAQSMWAGLLTKWKAADHGVGPDSASARAE